MSSYRDINTPYKELPHEGIEYSECKDFNHISRYKGLRQVVHNTSDPIDRFIALETPNAFNFNVDVDYHEVTVNETNRLDIIANNMLGNALYAWVIAYMNNIEDGFTIRPGQKLKVPKQLTSLFNSGEILQSVSPLALNLGSE